MGRTTDLIIALKNTLQSPIHTSNHYQSACLFTTLSSSEIGSALQCLHNEILSQSLIIPTSSMSRMFISFASDSHDLIAHLDITTPSPTISQSESHSTSHTLISSTALNSSKIPTLSASHSLYTYAHTIILHNLSLLFTSEFDLALLKNAIIKIRAKGVLIEIVDDSQEFIQQIYASGCDEMNLIDSKIVSIWK